MSNKSFPCDSIEARKITCRAQNVEEGAMPRRKPNFSYPVRTYKTDRSISECEIEKEIVNKEERILSTSMVDLGDMISGEKIMICCSKGKQNKNPGDARTGQHTRQLWHFDGNPCLAVIINGVLVKHDSQLQLRQNTVLSLVKNFDAGENISDKKATTDESMDAVD